MNILEMCNKMTLEANLKEFGKKYAEFCNGRTCYTCPLSPLTDRGLACSPRKACKVYVIDHLTEANRKMDEAIAKEKEVKKDEYAEKLLFAIRDRKRELEYYAKSDADYVILNSGDYTLLKSRTTWSSICLAYGSDICYENIYGMKIVCDIFVRRGEFVIGFKTDAHIKEATE